MDLDIKNEILIQAIEHSNLAHTISRVEGDMELIYVNQAFLDQTGYEYDEVIERNCRFLQGPGTDPEAVKAIRKVLAECESLDIEILNYKKDGTPFWNRLRISPVYGEDKKVVAYIGVQSDVTYIHEKNRLEQERQKLEALGRLTGNISHEIKNALQPVKLMSEMLNDWRSLDDEQIERCIGILSENATLAGKITQDVLSFSRRSSEELEAINTEDLRVDVTRFIKNLLHGDVTFSEVIQDNPFNADLFVNIRHNNLHQILINLVNNALHAMAHKGALTLHWGYEIIDSFKASELGLGKSEYLCISIEDNGCGMKEKTIVSAFDPFFSTKPPGEGTGLGLSISYRMAKEWDGTIIISSKKDEGTIFTMYIPVKFKR